jgi:hypothetical protein
VPARTKGVDCGEKSLEDMSVKKAWNKREDTKGNTTDTYGS